MSIRKCNLILIADLRKRNIVNNYNIIIVRAINRCFVIKNRSPRKSYYIITISFIHDYYSIIYSSPINRRNRLIYS